MIKTARLIIHAAGPSEMEKFIESQTVDVLKTAYSEMLTNSLNHPNEWEWYAIWMIELKDGTHIGELCFKGINSGIAEIGYGIIEAYQCCGYASEAVKAVSDWAFQHSQVTALTAETDAANTASQKVLKKCGFIRTDKSGEEGPIYILTR